MKPCASISFHGASKRFGPMRLNTSPSRPSSRTSVAVRPRRRRACSSAVSLNTGRGQQVHLVVDDEAPVERVEQREVGVLALPLRGEDLVRRDRDRLDLLHLPRVLADLVGGEARALEQLVAPLAGRDGVRDEDERRGLRRRHRAGADERLAGAAGQHDDARAAVEEVVDGLLLVVAQVPAGLRRGRSRAACRACSRRGPRPASRASRAPA